MKMKFNYTIWFHSMESLHMKCSCPTLVHFPIVQFRVSWVPGVSNLRVSRKTGVPGHTIELSNEALKTLRLNLKSYCQLWWWWWWYLDYSVNCGPFLRFSMRFEFLSEISDHSVCETIQGPEFDNCMDDTVEKQIQVYGINHQVSYC